MTKFFKINKSEYRNRFFIYEIGKGISNMGALVVELQKRNAQIIYSHNMNELDEFIFDLRLKKALLRKNVLMR